MSFRVEKGRNRHVVARVLSGAIRGRFSMESHGYSQVYYYRPKDHILIVIRYMQIIVVQQYMS